MGDHSSGENTEASKLQESACGKGRMKEREHFSLCKSGEAVGSDAADSTVNFSTSFAEIRDAKLQEKIEFVQAIARRQDVIFGDGINYSTRLKEEAWREVAKEVERMGLKSFAGKTWTRLRDHDWQYVRRHALARCESHHRPSGKLGELDRLVLTLITNSNARFSADFSNEKPAYDVVCDDLDLLNDSHETKQEALLPEATKGLSCCSDESSPCQMVGRLSEQSSSSQPVDYPGTNDVYFRNIKDEKDDFCTLRPQRDVFSDSFVSSVPDRNSRIRAHCSTQTLSDAINKADAVNYCSAKRPRITEQSSVDDNIASGDAQFLRRKQQLELRRMELENEKLEREIQNLVNQDRRAKDMHNIELRRARFQLVMMGADLLQEPQRDE